MTFHSFFIGLVCIAIGVVLVWKSRWLVDNFGHIGWADKYLGAMAGTYTFYRLLGVILAFGGFLYMFGLFDNLVGAIFGPLLAGFRPNR